MDLIRRKQNNILLHRVTIGEKTVSIPVAHLGHEGERTILITAGVDGDEYAGIEAAYALIDFYSRQKFSYHLIIIPILNIPGFESGTSWNPIDHKYPKHIFPGKEKGSSSEKLMYWVSENFIKDIDIWIDLHCGASTESIQPFIQIWETPKKALNQKIKTVLSKVKAENIVYTKGANATLVKRNCIYVRLESGELGIRNKKAIKQHVDWTIVILNSFQDLNQLVKRENKSKKIITKKVWRDIREFVSEKEGIWVPKFFGKTVKKGVVLGEIKSLDGKTLQKIIAKEHGVCLWRREAMSCKKGDSLYAYAHNKSSL